MDFCSLLKERKQRWMDFMDMSSPTRNVFLIHYYGDMPARPPQWPEKDREQLEWIARMYEFYVEQTEWLTDDRVPFLDMLTGTEIFAEAFGCRVHRPETDMPFALPLVRSAGEASRLKAPELGSSTLARLFEMADKLRELEGKQAVLRLPDIQSPMDITALIWDKNDLFVAMLETPEAVKELCGKVEQLLFAFLDEWFSRYGREFVAHFPCYYMPQGISVSEDEIGSVSPEMFEEFFLPHLVRLSERYGGIGIHCCATAKHQWHNFKKIPGLKLLNLVQPPEVLQDAYGFFSGHTAQMHSWCGGGPAWTWAENFPGAKFVLEAYPGSRTEAEELSEKLQKICR